MLDLAVFLDELALLAAFAIGGAGVAPANLKVAAAVTLPILTALMWGTWLAPKASRRLGRRGSITVKMLLFTAAATLLFISAWTAFAIAFWLLSVPLIFYSERDRRA